MGGICALLALGSIFVGKMAAIQFAAPDELRKMAAENLTMELYEETTKDAEDLSKLTAEHEHPQFMVDHGFTEAEAAAEVTEDELAGFREHSVPRLTWFQAAKPGYETWRGQETERLIESAMAEIPLAELAKESLGFMDIIFAVLGLATAYKLGCGGVSAGKD